MMVGRFASCGTIVFLFACAIVGFGFYNWAMGNAPRPAQGPTTWTRVETIQNYPQGEESGNGFPGSVNAQSTAVITYADTDRIVGESEAELNRAYACATRNDCHAPPGTIAVGGTGITGLMLLGAFVTVAVGYFLIRR